MESNKHHREVVPRVSVIMPTFNCAEHVAVAVRSVLAQTFAEWELIVVDDASTDNTVEIVREFLPDPRITVINSDINQGSGFCRNLAIENARGEFVAVHDADDVSAPWRLAMQVDEFNRDDDVAVVGSQVLEFGNWGGPVLGTWPTEEHQIRLRQMNSRMPVAHPTVMFRKRLLEAAGGYDVACRRAQDFALFLRLHDQKITCVGEPLVMYRTQRPVSLAYVVRNQKYVELALSRQSLRDLGATEAGLPIIPKTTLGTLYRSLRSWGIRNLRELFDGSKGIAEYSRF